MAKSDRKNPAEDVPAVTRLSDYTVDGGNPESWTSEAQLPAERNEPAELTADYGKVGEHVTSVLEAANEAAAKISDQARSTAREITARAQREAAILREKAQAETEELSRQASRLRAEAAEESRELEERANTYAAEKRREADSQATILVSRAKREASEYASAARERGAELAKNVELSEQRLRQLVAGLRDLAVRLEELLQAPVAPEHGAVEPPTNDESIEKSLRPSAAAQETSQPQHQSATGET